MGKASSSKKVARVARAGGSKRSGQRRPLGFPLTIGVIVVLGLSLVLYSRHDRIANAAPRTTDHWHEPFSIYTCVPDASTPVTPTTSTTTSTTAPTTTATTAPGDTSTTATTAPATTTTTAPAATTTTAPTSTTIAGEGQVPGQFLAHPTDAVEDTLGIHTHGDGVIHIHPFAASSSGRKATLDKFITQVGATLNDTTLSLVVNGEVRTYTEGVTKCQGGKDAIVQVAVWDKAETAAKGEKPNTIVTSNFGAIRLRNAAALSIAFLPADSTIPAEKDVEDRLKKLTDVDASTTTVTTAVPGSSSSGGATSTTVATDSNATTTSSSTPTTVAGTPTSSTSS